ncbi:MAG TPA: hypothetical protein VIM31_00330 [Candidatus Microsaccharimonas sp.]|jgi:hypothetical protein
MVEVVVGSEREHPKDQLIAQSASELLQNVSEIIRLWPEEATATPSFLQQIDTHNEHIKAFQDVASSLPDPTIPLETAFGHNLISAEQLKTLYQNLTDMLYREDTQRLVLYLPFEFLPSAAWTPEDAALQTAVNEFKDSYLHAWKKQLFVHDVRANFADGDVLEESQRTSDLPRVVKAAHLIPELLAHGLIDSETVKHLFDTTKDALLKKSISEAIDTPDSDTPHLSSVNPNFTAPSHTPTKRRQEWLSQKSIEQQISTYGKELGQYIIESTIQSGTVPNVSFENTSELGQHILIEGVQTAVEQAKRDGTVAVEVIYNFFRTDLIHHLQTTDIDAIKDRITQLLRRVHKLGLVSESELTNLTISLPRLSGDLTKNLELMPESVLQIKQLTELIHTDPELTAMIYPLVAVGGSRVKGYGTHTSDVDISIFVRPETSPEHKQVIRKLLQKHLTSANIDDEPTEFWLEQDNENLVIKAMEDSDAVVADTYWTHILFNAPMIGQPQEIRSLRKQLLLPYFKSSSHQTFGRGDRALYLERMEQDLLQYRLMHKGYERQYPRVSQPRKKSLDGDSMFWDAGYRRLATELFIEKVFLPKISSFFVI